MKVKSISLFLVSLFICFSSFAVENTNNGGKSLSQLKLELEEANKDFPQEIQKGMWIWSISLKERTIYYTFKYSQDLFPAGSLPVDKHAFDAIGKYFASTMISSMNIGEINTIINNNVSIKLLFYIKESNYKLGEYNITTEDFKQAYQDYISSPGYAGHRPLSYYKDGFEAEKRKMPYELTGGVVLFDVNMVGTELIYDCYMDDLVSLYADYEESRKYCIDLLRSYGSKEMHDDLKTYKIKVHYRYYSKSTKKLIKDIVVDCSKDL